MCVRDINDSRIFNRAESSSKQDYHVCTSNNSAQFHLEPEIFHHNTGPVSDNEGLHFQYTVELKEMRNIP